MELVLKGPTIAKLTQTCDQVGNKAKKWKLRIQPDHEQLLFGLPDKWHGQREEREQ
ncbi:unnamed protein product, partial [Dovyalis caffra]